MMQPAGFDGHGELQHPRLVGGKIEPRAPVVAEHPHVVNRRDALGFEAPPHTDAIEKRGARRSQGVNARIPIGTRRDRWLALRERKLEPTFGKRRREAGPGKPSTDDDDVEIHARIVPESSLTTIERKKDNFGFSVAN